MQRYRFEALIYVSLYFTVDSQQLIQCLTILMIKIILMVKHDMKIENY